MPSSLVSIITPSLRQGHFLEQAIDSIAAQDYPHIEHIIVDGGSDDETLSIIKRNESRIARWISEPDRGTSEAINKGLSMASGDFVWMLNADDLLIGQTAISILVDALLKRPDTSFAYGDMILIDSIGKCIGTRSFGQYGIDELLSDRRHLPFPGCLMRRSAIARVGAFDETLLYANDLDFFFRLAFDGPLLHCPTVTGALRIHGAASTQANVAAVGRETLEVCRRYLIRAQGENRLRSESRLLEAALDAYGASFSFHIGAARDVRTYVRQCFAKSPARITDLRLWAYFLSAMLGDRSMLALSRFTRRLIKNQWAFALNNWIFRTR